MNIRGIKDFILDPFVDKFPKLTRLRKGYVGNSTELRIRVVDSLLRRYRMYVKYLLQTPLADVGRNTKLPV